MQYRHVAIGLFAGLALGAGVSTVVAQNDTNKRPETIVREGVAPTRQAPNGKAQATLYAEGEKGFLGKLRLRPGAKVPEHKDKSEEYLYVLRGKGTITIDGRNYEITPHTGVYLPPDTTVKFQNGDKIFEAVQFFAPPTSANKYSDWETGQIPMKSKKKKGRRGRMKRTGQ